MENIAILSFNILLILAIWYWLWKPAIKTRRRANLHLLKKESSYFFKKNYSLEHPLYKRVLENIQGTMRALDKISFVSYLAWNVEVKKNPGLVEHFSKTMDKEFHTNDPKIQAHVEKVRRACAYTGIDYMVRSSVCLQLLFWMMAIYFGLRSLFKYGQVTITKTIEYSTDVTQKRIKPIFIEGLSSKW